MSRVIPGTPATHCLPIVHRIEFRHHFVSQHWIRISAALCPVLLLTPASIHAASRWSATYGGPATYEQPLDLRELPDHSIVVAGVTDSWGTQTGDAWWFRLDPDGAVLDEHVYGNSLPSGAAAIAIDADGGMAVVGAHMLDLFNDRDAWIHHVDASGDIDWEVGFDFDPGLHAFYAVAGTSDGGYIATGSTTEGHGATIYAWVVKLDGSGNVQWQNRYGGGNGEHANFVTQTLDGGYAIAGWTSSSGAGMTDVWLLKINSTGVIQWQKSYGGLYQEEATGLIQTADGGYALAAFTDTYPTSGHGAWVLRLNSAGALLWHAIMGHDWGDFRGITQTSDGNLIATGRKEGPASNDLLVVKLRDTDGALLWQRAYQGTQGDWGSQTLELADHDLLIAGIWAWGFAEEDIWLQRTDSNGLIPSCDLIYNTSIVPWSPSFFISNAVTVRSNPDPVSAAISFVSDRPSAVIDEKCRAPTGVEDDGADGGIDSGDIDSGTALGRVSVAPNPVRDAARISFEMREPAWMRVVIRDAAGRQLEVLAEGIYAAGKHELQWDVPRGQASSGVYFMTLERAGGIQTQRAIVVR